MTPSEFCTLVRETFAFLERDFSAALEGGNWGAPASLLLNVDPSQHVIGRLGPNGGQSVRFDSPRVFVRVVYDATGSWELWLELGLQADVSTEIQDTFGLSELLRAAGHAQLAREVAVIQTPQRDLRHHLARMATLLRDHCGPFLAGELDRFATLDAQQRSDCEAYMLEMNLGYARQDAQRAWDQGNFQEVVNKLEPFLQNLMPSERKRLAIARKRCDAL